VEVRFGITSALIMNAGTINLGDGPSVVGMGASSSITLAAGAVLTTGADGGIDTSGSTLISGKGTIVAGNGTFNIGPGVTIAGGASDDLHFQIKNNATLEIEDSILGGTFTFENAGGGSQLSLLGALPAGNFPGTIVGLIQNTTHNDLVLSTKVTTATLSNTSVTGADLVINNTTTFTLAGDYSTSTTTMIAGSVAAGFHIFVTCFGPGTEIETPDGGVAVETIRPGDAVMTIADGYRVPGTVKWTGYRHVDCRHHPEPRNVWPVRVRPGAFADGMPHHDLLLSPDHAVFLDDVLIPIKCLINGSTIEQAPVDELTYYHVELSHHGVLLAEGLPVESYLDTGDRSNFDNGGGVIAVHPDFSTRMWEAMGCAPLVVYGERLNAVRRQLEERRRVPV
jgi:hypothetical protein